MNIEVRLLSFLFFICLSFSSCQRNTNSIKIKGSDSVLPISQREAEAFMEQNPQAGVTVTGGGSGVGIAALIDGTTHIAMSSREIKIGEKLRLKDKNRTLREVTIAYDALALVVHPANPIKALKREDIEKIYTGKIDNWKDLGGKDQKIVAYARESSSGTYEYFKEAVLDRKEYASSVRSLTSNGAIIQSVGQAEGALGYIGLAYLNPKVKAIQVSFDKGKNFVDPSFENAKNKIYPISRPLYYYFVQESQSLVQPYLDFAFSGRGQKIITDIGYVPNK
ncbi:MAG: PstS family phosphate ABC transporter substrate-binding protein [Microscillaceae bacterium]|nr:PstS family phosphate ABC transporter substrate-binding protein [Microscillaceae bacterium]